MIDKSTELPHDEGFPKIHPVAEGEIETMLPTIRLEGARADKGFTLGGNPLQNIVSAQIWHGVTSDDVEICRLSEVAEEQILRKLLKDIELSAWHNGPLNTNQQQSKRGRRRKSLEQSTKHMEKNHGPPVAGEH
ncbi:hypothetical protein FOZ63_007004, partial [Perkinsus olseni]